jgi:hypothetical protein
MRTAPETIRDAWQVFNDMHGVEHPERTIEELRFKIHEAGLLYGEDDEAWDEFFANLFESGWVYGD